ncbi:MAG: sigma-54 dependent transcriptional regulator, partial [Muribaculaceae bacterium]|nr:sigma-54 dependent transcriptional regulator [Muribaculaceae bacterium]
IIHQGSARKHSKYIAVNCGAIPEGTIDSELFGHEKGSFTGAVGTRKGYFEEADGGTIFLDEVAELPLSTQARLLRVLETGEFFKVGSSNVQRTDIRVVAATNVDMQKAVAEGRFREDLYYRLSTVQITVPPLRDRGTDIVLLARKFAADFSERYRTPAIALADSARQMLMHYRWPGNVRQLKNVVEQISLFEAGTTIDADIMARYLPQANESYAPVKTSGISDSHRYDTAREVLFNMIFRLRDEVEALRDELKASHMPPQDTTAAEVSLRHSAPIDDHIHSIVKYTQPSTIIMPEDASTETLEETERETIKRSLERNLGRRKATAQELNISERTLYRKIKEYGLE